MEMVEVGIRVVHRAETASSWRKDSIARYRPPLLLACTCFGTVPAAFCVQVFSVRYVLESYYVWLVAGLDNPLLIVSLVAVVRRNYARRPGVCLIGKDMAIRYAGDVESFVKLGHV